MHLYKSIEPVVTEKLRFIWPLGQFSSLQLLNNTSLVVQGFQLQDILIP